MITTSPTPPPWVAGLSGDKNHRPGPMSNHAQDMGPVPAAVVAGEVAGEAPHPMITKLSEMMCQEFN